MSLQLIEGYDWLPTTTGFAQLNTLFNAFGWNGDMDLITTVAGTSTAFGYGKAASFTPYNAAFHGLYRPLPQRYTNTVYVGRRMYFTNGGTDSWAFGFYDSLSTQQLQFFVRPSGVGQFLVYTGAGALIGATRSNVFQFNKHFYMEMKYKCHPTAGLFELRINTVPVLSIPVYNTANGTPLLSNPPGFDMLYMQYQSFGGSTYIEDDLYVCDDSGSSNNGYLGNVRVPAQMVNGNSTPLNFAIGGTSPAPTNWQSQQNLNLTDAQYVYSPNAGDIDLYTLQSIINSPFVHGVQASIAYRQDDATQRVTRNVIKSGASTVEGANHYINQSYTFYTDVYETDPATGVGWTGAALNALKIGPKVQV